MWELTMALILNTLQIAWRQGRRLVVLVIGLTVLAFGVAPLVLPGPAFVVIPVGLGILSVEFAWARAWLRKLRSSAEAAADRIRHAVKSPTEAPDVNAQAPASKCDQALSIRLQ